MKQAVSDITNLPVKLRKQSQQPTERTEIPIVSVKERQEQIEVFLPLAEDLDTKKANRHLALSILAVFEVATREKTRDKQRKLFTELLLKLLARW